MEAYRTCSEMLDAAGSSGMTLEITDALCKTWNHVHGFTDSKGRDLAEYGTIMVSVSGGADSDIVTDMIERVGYPASKVVYVFYDTGLEFEATKEHLDFLEEKYGITIQRVRAKVPVPLGVKRYGVPFLSKRVSNNIGRLQSHGFLWKDRPFEELLSEYPRCKSALRWWCNEWGDGSKMGIDQNKWLKEFMVENPPDFPISDGCCTGAKKGTAKRVAGEVRPDLDVQGVRKFEGGARSVRYSSCFDNCSGGCSKFRPIFWFRDSDKTAYEHKFGVVHSRCYTEYGLRRTGCACCPFGRGFEEELRAAEEYEPKLFKAAMAVFGKSYEYTRKYREFCEKMNRLSKYD